MDYRLGNRNFLQGLNLIGLRRKNIPNKKILSGYLKRIKKFLKQINLTEQFK